MRLTRLTRNCGSAACPQVFASDRDTFVFQGTLLTVPPAEAATAPGEGLVELPRHLLIEVLPVLQRLLAGADRPTR
jgi:hypothetical protein